MLSFVPSEEDWQAAIHCRAKLWQQSACSLRSRLLGRACIGVPHRADSGPVVLAGSSELALRMDVKWIGLDKAAATRVADSLGSLLVETAAKSNWLEVIRLAQLADEGGWPGDCTEQCRSLVTGRADKHGRTALHLCIAGPQTQASSCEAAVGAASALMEEGADMHALDSQGESPLTAALRLGGPFATLLLHQVDASLAAAAGLSFSEPERQGAVDWQKLRQRHSFALALLAAERTASKTESDPTMASSQILAKTSTLVHALCHAVLLRFPAMALRALKVIPLCRCAAQEMEISILGQVLSLAQRDKRWLQVLQAQLRRFETFGMEAFQGKRQVFEAIGFLASEGQEKAQSLLVEASEVGRCDSPAVLFADRASECVVCFEPLYSNDPHYFQDAQGHRTCVHYVCKACAASCVAQKECPMCRTPIAKSVLLPHLESDPRGWFSAASGGEGRLDHAELCHAVAASLPVCEELLLQAVEKHQGLVKQSWDEAGHGTTTEDEFFDPAGGFFVWVLAHLQELHRVMRRGQTHIPDMRDDPASWFDFWDDRSIGSLTFGKLMRGVFGSCHLEGLEDRQVLHEVRGEIEKLWRAAGLEAESVSKADFLRPGGLAELLEDYLERADVPHGPTELAYLPSVRSFQTLPNLLRRRTTPEIPSKLAGLPGLDVLVARGFSREQAQLALSQADGDVERAEALLLRGGIPVAGGGGFGIANLPDIMPPIDSNKRRRSKGFLSLLTCCAAAKARA
eukprot:TRINITY_DN16379_c0_g2_i1.p1 TRINITY_DN16379_c0_g2~~TRINITY_DN16379_c0_g2_i1.p1  ORF type:complete len:837 (-),score=147.42 TRINITY_DN16379_c0_g2_i1:170-2395(-)